MNSTYTVVGHLFDNAEHKFGDYAIFSDAVEVWRGHHEKDGPVRIEKRNQAGETVQVWRGEWEDGPAA